MAATRNTKRKPASKKKPTYEVRPPAENADDFVGRHGAKALQRHSSTTPKRQNSTTLYTTREGTELRRVTYWLPTQVADELAVLAARSRTKDSHVAAFAVCKLLGLKIPDSLAHIKELFAK